MEHEASLQLDHPIATGRTAEIFAWSDGQILKLYRPGWSLDFAEHEAVVARAIYDSGVTAPAVGDVVEVAGRVGVIYERVEGPSLLNALSARPWTLRSATRTLAELHAGIHQHTVADLPRLKEVMAHRIRGASLLSQVDQKKALDTLAALPDADTMCHYDFHPDNVLLSARGPMVIDWGSAMLGDPLADVAHTRFLLSTGALYAPSPAARMLRQVFIPTMIHLYLRRYRQLHPFTGEQLAAWELPVLAARLSDEIEEEYPIVLARIRKLTAQ